MTNPNNVKIQHCESRQIAIEKAGLKLQELINDNCTLDKGLLLLLSGGSSLALVENIDTKNFSKAVTIGVLDERYSDDTQVNNFRLITQTNFYHKSLSAGANFIDTRIANGESSEELGQRFESALKRWCAENPEGRIIITQGIGINGHTSGIMPFPEDPAKFVKMFDDERWVIAYDATGKDSHASRVTTTLPFLRSVDASILFVCGEDKRPALARALDTNGEMATTPARVIWDMKQVFLFTDLEM